MNLMLKRKGLKTLRPCAPKVEAIIKAVKPSDPPYVSGFEPGAVNGEGWGIDPFRPVRPLTKLSNKMFLTAPTLERMRVRECGGGWSGLSGQHN